MAFDTVQIGSLRYLTSDLLPAAHGFTTRFGGVSRGYLSSLNLGIHRGDSEENVTRNYEILASALGFDTGKLILTHQVHGEVIRCVTEADCAPLFSQWPDCDALITDKVGLALAVFTADCTPVLLQDRRTGAVGAVHAGWRGTALDLAGKTAQAMCDQLGCRMEDIRAAIGPNIGPCCFETGPEVPEAMLSTFGQAAEPWIRPQGDKFYVNLKAINALSLTRRGVAQVDICAECTRCKPDWYWSHRVTGCQRGSQGAIIVCQGG